MLVVNLIQVATKNSVETEIFPEKSFREFFQGKINKTKNQPPLIKIRIFAKKYNFLKLNDIIKLIKKQKGI